MKKSTPFLVAVKTLALILICSSEVASQSYFFRHYQVENGLSNNAIHCSIQDKYGFMWFGTRDGLNRFDGYHFKTYKIEETGHRLAPDLIYCITTDKNGTLWLGSSKGLYMFDSQKERIISIIDTLKEVTNVQIDYHQQIWFVADETLYRYNPITKRLKVFSTSNYFSVLSIAIDTRKQLWIGSTDGFLHQLDINTETFKSHNVFRHSPKAPSYNIQKIYCLDTNTILVGTVSQGLKKFDTNLKTYQDILTYNPDKSIIHIRDIKQCAKDEIWFATESGIFILNTVSNTFTNLKKKFLDPFSISDNAVYSLCKDNEGGIWAGTFFGGINYYSKKNSLFEKYFADNSKKSLTGNVIREICPDRFGNIWIGTEDAGLNKLNPKNGAITQFIPDGKKGSITYSNIQGLLNIDNDLWIGTFEHGLDIMDIKTGKIKKHFNAGEGKHDLKSNFIGSIFQTKSGDILLGTANSLMRYNPKIKGFDLVNPLYINTFISSILEDNTRTIWLGTNKGIYYFNPFSNQRGHFFNNPKDPNSLTNNSINALIEDSKQNLWFATEGGGICKLGKDRKTLTTLTTKDGLPSNFILKIIEDSNHTLWIATSRGLVNYNPVNKHIVTYTKDNGLLNDQFNYNSGYIDLAGKMYFGSVKGMITFNPKNIVQSPTNASVFITDFQVDNKLQKNDYQDDILKQSIIHTQEITLPHDKSSFSIDFTALSYASPEKTIFSYFMKGLDNGWTEIKPNRKVYFTNLSSGTYIFQLRASINGNTLLKEEKQLTINILSPWWASFGAYLVYSIIFIAVIYQLFISYHIIIEDRKEKEIYEAKIDFFTNLAHEIRTPLTLIKGPIENLLEQVPEIPSIQEDVVLMDRNTNRLITLVTQILDFRKVETKSFNIDLKEVNITELLKESYLNFTSLTKKRKLDFSIEYPPTDIYAYVDEEALNKIFSNLFSNAIKFAHKKIRVRMLPLAQNAVNCIIEFENDGLKIPSEKKEKIFEPFYRLKESKQEGTGIGLALARSLTELLDGELYLRESNDNSIIFVLSLPTQSTNPTP